MPPFSSINQHTPITKTNSSTNSKPKIQNSNPSSSKFREQSSRDSDIMNNRQVPRRDRAYSPMKIHTKS